jgi:hypothetical protein
MRWNISIDIESRDIQSNITHQVLDFVDEAVNVKADESILLLADLKLGRPNDIGGFDITINGTLTQPMLDH